MRLRGSGGNRGDLIGAVAFLAVVGCPVGAIAETRGTFGLPGIIDMPSAESARDGMIGASIFGFPGGQRTTLSFQMSDRLTGAFRYSNVPGISPTGGDLYDRSFDIQYRILDEGGMRPAIAIGLRDLIGTGLYGSEYVVATKTVSPGLTLSGGLGWGRLGSHGDIGGPFGKRPPLDYTDAGKVNSDQWFRGPVSPFFGLSWAANDKLTLKAEYSSDAYAQEVTAGALRRQSSVNLGFDYRLGQMASVSGYYLHGSDFGLQFNLFVDPRSSAAPSGLESAPLPVRPRPSRMADSDAYATDWEADPEVLPGIQSAIAAALAKDGQVLESMSLSAGRVEVRVRNQKYLARPQAIGRTARGVTRALPPSVETLIVTEMVQGIPTASVTFDRSDIEALESEASMEILQRTDFSDPLDLPPAALRETEGIYPRFTWSFGPYVEAGFAISDTPLRAALGAQLAARYEIAPGWVAAGAIRKQILGNLGDSLQPSTSVVPHVRTDFDLYHREGDPAIDYLTLAWYARPAPNLYSRITIGYLEQMYGGLSGELLWKPVNSRLALGAELNYAMQRDFDQLIGFRDYDVVTGHASAYYDFGSGLVGELDVGRYLAGDFGATLSIDREFANGWRVGAFATLTDMSAADFGEGAFDKGIRLTIPLAWATGTPSMTTTNTTIRPLTRDGGARLQVAGRLYDTIRTTHRGALQDEWGRFWR